MLPNLFARLAVALLIVAACTATYAQEVETPPIFRYAPKCVEVSSGAWLAMAEERGIAKDRIAIISDKATIERAVQVYYGGVGDGSTGGVTPIAFDTVILVKADKGLVLAYAKDGKMCGLMIVLDAKVQEAVVKHIMGTGV